MRYSIQSKKLTIPELVTVVQSYGGTSLKAMPLVHQVFADLDNSQVSQLKVIGLIVKAVKGVMAAIVEAPEVIEAPTAITVKTETGLPISETFAPLRDYFVPTPLTGVGLTVAVIDSGIRATHEAIKGRVILAENYSSSLTEEDVYDHGTNIASIIIAISPSASLMNIKVLDDTGMATEEEVVAGIESVCELVEVARKGALLSTAELWPNLINLSLGSEDDADYDNILRSAVRVAIEEYGLEVIASAGNGGPKMSTITNPATEPLVIAAGAIADDILEVWEMQSRGPTLLGDVKPDFLTWGVNVNVASSKGDQEYLVKSGTSFATPVLSGARGLLDEIARRVYGEQYNLPWADIAKVAPLFCIKAEGAPLKKDNSWGYGFPSFGVIAYQLTTPTAGVGIEGIIESITPLISLAMLSMIMQGMGGGFA